MNRFASAAAAAGFAFGQLASIPHAEMEPTIRPEIVAKESIHPQIEISTAYATEPIVIDLFEQPDIQSTILINAQQHVDAQILDQVLVPALEQAGMTEVEVPEEINRANEVVMRMGACASQIALENNEVTVAVVGPPEVFTDEEAYTANIYGSEDLGNQLTQNEEVITHADQIITIEPIEPAVEYVETKTDELCRET